MNPLAELELDEVTLNKARALIKQWAGISLGSDKRALIYSRLAPLVRTTQSGAFKRFIERVERGEIAQESFVNALTTNVTSFFREPHHFESLKGLLTQRIAQRARRLRVWSAACSSGEEPASIVIAALEVPGVATSDFKVLATDLDSKVLETAARGRYSSERLSEVPERLRRRYFGPCETTAQVQLRDEVLRRVTFRRLNLLEALPPKGPFDAIFCRNVLIYFDEPTRRDVVGRLAELLGQGGLLFLGHSESLMADQKMLKSKGQTTFERVVAPRSRVS